ncbi:unnamed protein product [Angiostrongylus costaricensis]|uniref:ICE1 n=1 Tax=Angiostrongylus costaricensis TaxID=334426 RepID=A0A158PKP3_ANGCS|nr:unnamed protein product [Angiostrongylus costaricensis]
MANSIINGQSRQSHREYDHWTIGKDLDRFKKQSRKEAETVCTQHETSNKPHEASYPQIRRPLPCSLSRKFIEKKSCSASHSMSEIGSSTKVAFPSIPFPKKAHLYFSTVSSLPATSSESPNSSPSFLYSFSIMLQNTSKACDFHQKVENLSSRGCEIMCSPSHSRKSVQLMPPPLPSKSINGDYSVKTCTTFLARNVQETPSTPISDECVLLNREEIVMVGNQSSKGRESAVSPSQSRTRVRLMPPPLPSENMNSDYSMKISAPSLVLNLQETSSKSIPAGHMKRSREETSLIGNQSSKVYEITGPLSQSTKREQLLTSPLPSKNVNRNYCMEKSTQGHIPSVHETYETALASASTEHTKLHREELPTKTSSHGPADAPSEKTEWNECQNLVYLYKRGAKIFTLDNIPVEELWYKEAFVAQKNLMGRSSAVASHGCRCTNNYQKQLHDSLRGLMKLLKAIVGENGFWNGDCKDCVIISSYSLKSECSDLNDLTNLKYPKAANHRTANYTFAVHVRNRSQAAVLAAAVVLQITDGSSVEKQTSGWPYQQQQPCVDRDRVRLPHSCNVPLKKIHLGTMTNTPYREDGQLWTIELDHRL